MTGLLVTWDGRKSDRDVRQQRPVCLCLAIPCQPCLAIPCQLCLKLDSYWRQGTYSSCSCRGPMTKGCAGISCMWFAAHLVVL